MPPHTDYIETHLGGGAVLRYKLSANRNIGIEIDPKVIEIWNDTSEIEFELIHGDAIAFLQSHKFKHTNPIGVESNPYLCHIEISEGNFETTPKENIKKRNGPRNQIVGSRPQ